MIKRDILINGNAYNWGSITVVMGGNPLFGISNINYSEEMTVVNYMNHSPFPSKQGYGNINVVASATLDQYEISILESVATNARIQNLPRFDIIVIFTPDNNLFRTLFIKNCKISTNGFDATQNDMNIETELNLNPTHIIHEYEELKYAVAEF